MIDFEECLSAGLIKRITPSQNQAEEQFIKAQTLFEEAKESMKIENPNSTVIASYAALLDASRAIMFKDGYREKSHACVVKYLEAKYPDEIGMDTIYLLDQYRDRRHKTLYSGSYYPTMQEAEQMISFTEKFLEKIEKILKKS